jgi:hypothetical protein
VSELHDRPHADELVAAVREFLEGDVMEATTGRVQFHARVAINALRMVERELTDGRSMEEAHRARVRALGYDSDADLAGAISAGELDDRLAAVRAAVYESVIDKLRIANPDYLEDTSRGGR